MKREGRREGERERGLHMSFSHVSTACMVVSDITRENNAQCTSIYIHER